MRVFYCSQGTITLLGHKTITAMILNSPFIWLLRQVASCLELSCLNLGLDIVHRASLALLIGVPCNVFSHRLTIWFLNRMLLKNHLCSDSMIFFKLFHGDVLILLRGTVSLFWPFRSYSYYMGYSDNNCLQFPQTFEILQLLRQLSCALFKLSKPGIFMFWVLLVPFSLKDVLWRNLLLVHSLIKRIHLNRSILFYLPLKAILLQSFYVFLSEVSTLEYLCYRNSRQLIKLWLLQHKIWDLALTVRHICIWIFLLDRVVLLLRVHLRICLVIFHYGWVLLGRFVLILINGNWWASALFLCLLVGFDVAIVLANIQHGLLLHRHQRI